MFSFDDKQNQLSRQLKQISVNDLPISDYSRRALKRVLVAIDYYLDIYRISIEHLLDGRDDTPADMTIVDYGGGHGLMSILAKYFGFGQVVYIDYNTDAVQTVRVLSEHLGVCPDVILQGDATVLKSWCVSNSVSPHALLGMDVIEHIYSLETFFAALHDIAPVMTMVFTTASTPFNQRVIRRLHRVMRLDEYGAEGKKGFCAMRRQFIKDKHPDMPDNELDYWARNTRGLTFDDVRVAVSRNQPNIMTDPYNTCDPQTGSWTERILPISDYQRMLDANFWELNVFPGFYNIHRRGIKALISRTYNSLIGLSSACNSAGWRHQKLTRCALKKAPFIFLVVKPKQIVYYDD